MITIDVKYTDGREEKRVRRIVRDLYKKEKISASIIDPEDWQYFLKKLVKNIRTRPIRANVFPKKLQKIDELDIVEHPNMFYSTLFFVLFVIAMLYLVFLI